MHLIQNRIIMFFILCQIRLRKGEGKILRLKTAVPCFGDHIIPYHKAKMLYLSNLEKNFFRIAGALKLHFFGFSVLTIGTIGHFSYMVRHLCCPYRVLFYFIYSFFYSFLL